MVGRLPQTLDVESARVSSKGQKSEGLEWGGSWRGHSVGKKEHI